ncbi:MAG: hypothetical protein HOC23_06925 [Halieaceae bacterium]|jgi:tetratricopeptide (TPR) repeat protein|nr:hypothetical protein [Halieaceae bacterium]
MNSCHSRLIAACLSAFMTACVSIPPLQDSVSVYVEQQKASARALENQGRFAESLSRWRSLLALDLPGAEVPDAIDKLERIISTKVAHAWREAEAAYTREDNRRGDTWMLKVLALEPGSEKARRRLAASKSVRNRAQLDKKSSQETQQRLVRERRAPGGINHTLEALKKQHDYAGMLAVGRAMEGPPDTQSTELLYHANLALADQAEQSNNLEAALTHLQAALILKPHSDDPLASRVHNIRGKLSTVWYRQGIQLVNVDLTQAIAALEKSLSYNADNQAAQRKLKQTRTLFHNLQRIQAKSTQQ